MTKRDTRFLFIRGIPVGFPEEHIKQSLEGFGKIQSIKVHEKDGDVGVLVVFLSLNSASEAVKKCNSISNIPVTVDFCESNGSPWIEQLGKVIPVARVSTPPAATKKALPSNSQTIFKGYESISSEDDEVEASSASNARSVSSSSSRSSSAHSTGSSSRIDGRERGTGLKVSNLHPRSSNSSVREGLFHEFKKYGKVISIVLNGDGPSRYGIITFRRATDATAALKSTRRKVFLGTPITVEPHEGVDVEDPDLCPPEQAKDEYHVRATRTLFVGNLASDLVKKQDLYKNFARYGHILEVDIKQNASQNSAYAFIQYNDIRSVVNALNDKRKIIIYDREVKLGFGKSQTSRFVWLDALAPSVEHKFLYGQMKRFGKIRSVELNHKLMRGLVEFESVEAAQTAVSEMKHSALAGKRVQIDFASNECREDFYRQLKKSSATEDSQTSALVSSFSLTYAADAILHQRHLNNLLLLNKQIRAFDYQQRNGFSEDMVSEVSLSDNYRRGRQTSDYRSSSPESNHTPVRSHSKSKQTQRVADRSTSRTRDRHSSPHHRHRSPPPSSHPQRNSRRERGPSNEVFSEATISNRSSARDRDHRHHQRRRASRSSRSPHSSSRSRDSRSRERHSDKGNPASKIGSSGLLEDLNDRDLENLDSDALTRLVHERRLLLAELSILENKGVEPEVRPSKMSSPLWDQRKPSGSGSHEKKKSEKRSSHSREGLKSSPKDYPVKVEPSSSTESTRSHPRSHAHSRSTHAEVLESVESTPVRPTSSNSFLSIEKHPTLRETVDESLQLKSSPNILPSPPLRGSVSHQGGETLCGVVKSEFPHHPSSTTAHCQNNNTIAESASSSHCTSVSIVSSTDSPTITMAADEKPQNMLISHFFQVIKDLQSHISGSSANTTLHSPTNNLPSSQLTVPFAGVSSEAMDKPLSISTSISAATSSISSTARIPTPMENEDSVSREVEERIKMLDERMEQTEKPRPVDYTKYRIRKLEPPLESPTLSISSAPSSSTSTLSTFTNPFPSSSHMSQTPRFQTLVSHHVSHTECNTAACTSGTTVPNTMEFMEKMLSKSSMPSSLGLRSVPPPPSSLYAVESHMSQFFSNTTSPELYSANMQGSLLNRQFSSNSPNARSPLSAPQISLENFHSTSAPPPPPPLPSPSAHPPKSILKNPILTDLALDIDNNPSSHVCEPHPPVFRCANAVEQRLMSPISDSATHSSTSLMSPSQYSNGANLLSPSSAQLHVNVSSKQATTPISVKKSASPPPLHSSKSTTSSKKITPVTNATNVKPSKSKLPAEVSISGKVKSTSELFEKRVSPDKSAEQMKSKKMRTSVSSSKDRKDSKKHSKLSKIEKAVQKRKNKSKLESQRASNNRKSESPMHFESMYDKIKRRNQSAKEETGQKPMKPVLPSSGEPLSTKSIKRKISDKASNLAKKLAGDNNGKRRRVSMSLKPHAKADTDPRASKQKSPPSFTSSDATETGLVISEDEDQPTASLEGDLPELVNEEDGNVSKDSNSIDENPPENLDAMSVGAVSHHEFVDDGDNETTHGCSNMHEEFNTLGGGVVCDGVFDMEIITTNHEEPPGEPVVEAMLMKAEEEEVSTMYEEVGEIQEESQSQLMVSCETVDTVMSSAHQPIAQTPTNAVQSMSQRTPASTSSRSISSNDTLSSLDKTINDVLSGNSSVNGSISIHEVGASGGTETQVNKNGSCYEDGVTNSLDQTIADVIHPHDTSVDGEPVTGSATGVSTVVSSHALPRVPVVSSYSAMSTPTSLAATKLRAPPVATAVPTTYPNLLPKPKPPLSSPVSAPAPVTSSTFVPTSPSIVANTGTTNPPPALHSVTPAMPTLPNNTLIRAAVAAPSVIPGLNPPFFMPNPQLLMPQDASGLRMLATAAVQSAASTSGSVRGVRPSVAPAAPPQPTPNHLPPTPFVSVLPFNMDPHHQANSAILSALPPNVGAPTGPVVYLQVAPGTAAALLNPSLASHYHPGPAVPHPMSGAPTPMNLLGTNIDSLTTATGTEVSSSFLTNETPGNGPLSQAHSTAVPGTPLMVMNTAMGLMARAATPMTPAPIEKSAAEMLLMMQKRSLRQHRTVPPDINEKVVLQAHRFLWRGNLSLKNVVLEVEMHYIRGNADLITWSTGLAAQRKEGATLRICQRMRLEPTHLESLNVRLTKECNFCMCLGLATGVSASATAKPDGAEPAKDMATAQSILEDHFIQYLQEKQAAGIINVVDPKTQTSVYVVHIFPDCSFSRQQLGEFSPQVLERLQTHEVPYLLFVVSTAG